MPTDSAIDLVLDEIDIDALLSLMARAIQALRSARP
jgi:hypothetical protein